MTPADYFYFRVSISNLQGGHSGSDINKGLGNANKILARFLCRCSKKYDMVLCHNRRWEFAECNSS